MLYYSVLLCSITISGLLSISTQFANELQKREKIIYRITLIAFFIVHAFRNAMNVDYMHYVGYYSKINYFFRSFGFKYIFSQEYLSEVTEPGYALINILANYLFGSYKWVFIISAVLILFPLWRFAQKYSPSFLFSIFLYLMIGTYYEGFNIMRQMIAASICIMAFQYLKEKEFIRYCFVVVVGALFHSSAIVMLPMYFIMRPWKTKKYIQKASIILIALTSVLSATAVEALFTRAIYGVSRSLSLNTVSWKTIILPLLIIVICQVFQNEDYYRNRIDDNINDITCYNVLEFGTIIWVSLKIFCVAVPMATRAASFFCPYMIVYVPKALQSIPSKRNSSLCKLMIVVVLLLFTIYGVIVNKSMMEYKFDWSF